MPYRGEDVLQLGGDFILDRQRNVVFAYPSSDPTDRPSVAAMLEALRPVSSSGPMPSDRTPDRASVDPPSATG
jgi:hypothetical protein